MSSDSSPGLVNRLIAERAEAHRRYNEALTALDRAIQTLPEWPAPPAPYDEQRLPAINEAWRAIPAGQPARRTWWHRGITDSMWRLIGPMFERQAAFNAVLVDHLNRNAVAHREASAALAVALPATRAGFESLVRFESLLLQFLQQITPLADAGDRQVRDAIASLQGVAEVAQRAAVMATREIERLGAAPSQPGGSGAQQSAPAAAERVEVANTDAYKYLGFEDRFRGSEAEIRTRLADYLPYFDGASNVLDVGCGRGEFLQLLTERGISARGIDLNPEMAEACRARGLDASAADALTTLRELPDQSLGGLIAVQVIEHLKPAYLSQFLQTAFFKLRPGAPLVLETINPACWVAFFESYIRDLTHEQPIHSETLQASGFASVEVVFRSPVAEGGRLQRVTARPEHFGETADAQTALVSAFNHNVDRLNDRLFTFQDYAAIARVPDAR